MCVCSGLRGLVLFVKLLGSFRFDYEYEIEYDNDFRISNR